MSEVAAHDAVELSQVDPVAAIKKARNILTTIDSTATPSIASMCWRAVALAENEQGHIAPATFAIERSLEFARESGASELVSAARLTQSTILFEAGESEQAEWAAREAIRDAHGLQLARARGQLGLILHRIGRRREALEMFDMSIPELRNADDDRWVCRVLTNRSVHYMYENALTEAQMDLAEVLRRSELSGYVVGVVRSHQNLGCVEARLGNIAAALHHFGVAGPLAEAARLSVASIEADRCEALLLGGLYTDAIESAETAIQLCNEDGADADLAEAELQLARALLGSRRHREAADAARRASSRFHKQGRNRWASYADGVRHLAEPDGDADGTVGLRLRRDGWVHLACLADLGDARRAEDAGAIPVARLLFERVVAFTPNAGLELRLRSLEAALNIARLDSDHRRRPALIREARSVLGSLATTVGHELRVGLLSHHRSLVDAAVLDPWLDDKPAEVIQTIEALDFTPAALRRTSDEQQEPGAVEKLRGLRSVLWAGTSDDPVATERRIAELERKVLGSDRAQRNEGRLSDVADVARIGRRNDVAVVYATICRGLPLVFVLHNGSTRTFPFPASTPKMAADAAYLAGLHSTGLIPSAASTLNRVLHGLTERWNDVLQGVAADIPVVIVPGPFSPLPWGLLDTFRARRYTIVPSLTWWAEAESHAPHEAVLKRALFVEGPDLRDVEAEVAAIEAVYADVVILRGSKATSAAVLEQFGRVDVVHFAAHGEFRSDNSMLSFVRLYDGPLFVRDLGRVETPPKLAVFAACSTGQGRVFQAGTFGLSSLLLWGGASAMVAPHGLIDDHEVSPLMAEFHQLINDRAGRGDTAGGTVHDGGGGVAAALATLRTAEPLDSRRNHAAATFSVFGRDFCITD